MPALPPLASLHANAGRFVPGGVGGVTGGGEITGPILVRPAEAAFEVTAAVGELVAEHPRRTTLKAARATHPVKALISRGPRVVARTGE